MAAVGLEVRDFYLDELAHSKNETLHGRNSKRLRIASAVSSRDLLGGIARCVQKAPNCHPADVVGLQYLGQNACATALIPERHLDNEAGPHRFQSHIDDQIMLILYSIHPYVQSIITTRTPPLMVPTPKRTIRVQ